MRVFFWGIFFLVLFSSCENKNKNILSNTEKEVDTNIEKIENIVSEQTVKDYNFFNEKIITIQNNFEEKVSYGIFNTCDYDTVTYYFYKTYAIRNTNEHRNTNWIIANGFYINPNKHYEAFYPFRFYGLEVQQYGPGAFELNYADRMWDIMSESETEMERIITYYNKYGDYSNTLHYYNIPQEELLDIFHKNLIDGLLEFIDDYNSSYSTLSDRDFVRDWSNEMISNLDSEGLEIFRNLLFAKNNYKFNNVNWHNIFVKYLTDYNGFLNNDDSFSMFTEKEKELLEIIISKEK